MHYQKESKKELSNLILINELHTITINLFSLFPIPKLAESMKGVNLTEIIIENLHSLPLISINKQNKSFPYCKFFYQIN